MMVSCLAYSSTLKMKAVSSSENSVDFGWIAGGYIAEDVELFKIS
jgi:hypothetical protein